MTRAERVAQVRALLEEGRTRKEAAAELGVSYAYVRDLLSDPDGVKLRERHDRARGTCVECGRATSWPGGDTRTTRVVRCGPCERARVTLPCGTTAAYGRGCRCDACRAANAARMRAYKRERRTREASP